MPNLTILDSALDLTSLAQSVVLAASVIQVVRRGAAEPPLEALGIAHGIVSAWETLTGLSGDEAVAAAKALDDHPVAVQAVVIPF